jgi:hypothetical protein
MHLRDEIRQLTDVLRRKVQHHFHSCWFAAEGAARNVQAEEGEFVWMLAG